jgi:hypothetical protein
METYNIYVFGFDEAGGRSPVDGLHRTFGVSRAVAERMVRRLPSALKSGLSREKAERYAGVLEGIGAIVEIRPDPIPPRMVIAVEPDAASETFLADGAEMLPSLRPPPAIPSDQAKTREWRPARSRPGIEKTRLEIPGTALPRSGIGETLSEYDSTAEESTAFVPEPELPPTTAPTPPPPSPPVPPSSPKFALPPPPPPPPRSPASPAGPVSAPDPPGSEMEDSFVQDIRRQMRMAGDGKEGALPRAADWSGDDDFADFESGPESGPLQPPGPGGCYEPPIGDALDYRSSARGALRGDRSAIRPDAIGHPDDPDLVLDHEVSGSPVGPGWPRRGARLDVINSGRSGLKLHLLALAALAALVLLGLGYYRFRVVPLAGAEAFVRSEALRGFENAFSTPSAFGGVTPRAAGGTGKVFPKTETSVDARRFKIEDGSLSLFGGSARFRVRHVVFLYRYAVDLTHRVDVTVDSGPDGGWRYNRFVLKGFGPIDLVPGQNPFATALRIVREDREL